MNDKTHYRKAFNSPYLSSADIVGPTQLVIARVTLERDKTHKSKDVFNTAYFTAKELRPGEILKPMILNACNSKMMKTLTGSPFIDDWNDVAITVYVDHEVRFGRELVEGLRICKAEEAKPDATDEQLAAIQGFRERGQIKQETEDWMGQRVLTQEDAAKIINHLSGVQNVA